MKDKSLDEMRHELMTAKSRQKNLDRFIEDSAVKQRMYHGTSVDIAQFRPGQAGAIFVSSKPDFTEEFAKLSENREIQNLANDLDENPQAKRDLLVPLIDQAIADGRLGTPENTNGLVKTTRDQHIAYALDKPLGIQLTVYGYGNELSDSLRARLSTGMNIMPVHVQARNPFDYENPKHVNAVRAHVEKMADEGISKKYLSSGRWDAIEDETVQEAIRDLGFDSFYVKEGDTKNLGVYDSRQIKSATGNRGTYDPNDPDITKAKGGRVNDAAMGINVATDRKAGVRYADLIVDGHKTLESRNSDTLRPYVGKRVAIVRTGEGPAKAIGEVTIGEPMVVGKKEFRSLEDKHHVPEGSAFDITTPTKHLYPMHNPVRYETERDVGHGIVSRKVVHAAKGGRVKEPKKTVKAYKLFRVHKDHPGKLFPLFVDANTPVEMGKWVDAKEGEMKDGKVKSKIGSLAYRPGWHAGDLPIATHIGEKSDSSLTAPDRRPANHAWAEVEMPDDVDWQTEANKRGTNAQGKLVPVKAHITDQIPHGGHYRYKTNPNMTGNWLIGGSMKVNRVLTDKEVERINSAAGLSDLPREQPFKKKEFGFAGGGTVGPDEWMAEEHVNYPQRKATGGTPSLAEMKLALATGGQPDVNKVGFFNPVEKAALSLNRKRGAGNAFISDLKKTPGVNDQRLAELGLDDLATQPNVNQEDIVQRVQQNRIPLKETVLYPYEEDSEYSNTRSGLEQSVSYYTYGIQQMRDNIERLIQTAPNSPMMHEYKNKLAVMEKSLANAKERLALSQPATYGPDIHPELNAEGGQNYRELLMTLPAQVDTTGFNVTGGGNRWYLRDKNNQVIEAFPSEEEAKSKLESRAQDRQKNIYKSSHWNHPNVLLHLRMADHNDREGKRGLLIDELQSDWHQQGTKIGYGDKPKYSDEGMREYFNMDREEFENMPYEDFQLLRREYWSQLKQGVPDAPFKDNWHQLGLKRAIKEAADTGMKRLYLATGETQTQRYSEDQRKGMEHWYDNVYKNFLDKYAKQHGGKIGQTQLANGDLVHYIDIVPSMVEAVKKGQSYEYGGVVHKASGGNVNQGEAMPTLAEMRMALMQQNPITLKNVGVNEATEMDRKVYMPPNLSAGVMHAGGVDMSHEVPGQQMMPALPGTAPGQPGVPGQPPQGGPEGQMPGAQPSPMPTGFGNPPGPNAFPPSGPLPQPPSNILSMLPQGRALNAMQPTKMPAMAKGGSTTDKAKQMLASEKKATRVKIDAEGPGGVKGIVVPRHMLEGNPNSGVEGMNEVNKARAQVYGSENRPPLTLNQIGKIHKETLADHFKKPVEEQVKAEQEALARLRAAKHIGKTANTLDESEKLDTVRHEHDDEGRTHVGYASKGVAGHALYTSGHGQNEKRHVLNTCPGQTTGCGGGVDESGVVDTKKGTCFAPNAESQYPAAAVRRTAHEQAKHDPAMTRDWILAHTGSMREAANKADKKNQRTLFRPNVVDETDVSSRHVIRHLNEQRKQDDKPGIIANSYGKTNELHDPENGYHVTHSNVGPKVKHGREVSENIGRDKQRVRNTITATSASGDDFRNEQGNKTPPKGSYMVTDVKRGSPLAQSMQKHITHAKYWSTGREQHELTADEKDEGEEGHYGADGKPTSPDKAHYGHTTVNGRRYDYQKQHILHPRLVQVGNNKDGTPHMIPTDSRFKDTEFLPKKRFKTKNGKEAGHILMTTPTESTSNLGHETSFTHNVSDAHIEHAQQNKGEYEIDRPEDQEKARGREYAAPQPLKFLASGGAVNRHHGFEEDDYHAFPEQNLAAQRHLAKRLGEDEDRKESKPAGKKAVVMHKDIDTMRHEMMTKRAK